jgi:hypothetical protein
MEKTSMAHVFRYLVIAVALVASVAAWSPQAKAQVPVPSIYPVTWQLKFEYGKPARIVVNVPGKSTPQAYWYMPFSVTNTTDRERMYFPVFELVTEEGKILRSDKSVPVAVVNEIRKQQGNRFLQPLIQTAGELRLGDDETKYSAAVWAEPDLRMGHFSILVSGLSGESTTVKNAKDEDVVLRKTLQLNFFIRGDEVYPGEDEVNANALLWIMR